MFPLNPLKAAPLSENVFHSVYVKLKAADRGQRRLPPSGRFIHILKANVPTLHIFGNESDFNHKRMEEQGHGCIVIGRGTFAVLLQLNLEIRTENY